MIAFSYLFCHHRETGIQNNKMKGDVRNEKQSAIDR
jgi:hypothetical protein